MERDGPCKERLACCQALLDRAGGLGHAGVLEEDVIVALGEQPVTSVDDLHKLLTQLPVEVPSPILLLRGERRLERWVVPSDYPHQAPTP